ncbi:MAG TPA: alpha-2-macroglobulin [Povalibacter sp.]|uniref:alpha-2-macroglobulin family protein n=1 Tax=Povalibacter sp. TaxID=1962978 RepID=UPI002B8BAE59|nr:alpha-2-macroglobulin [Povalibacter sp.]HMN44184.1 alpha-2-macroglobulin [Povalibacter sp.]
MSAIGGRLRGIWRALVGDIAWTRPAWVTRSGAALQRGAAYVRANPRRVGLLSGALLAVALGAFFAWRWYENQPKPVEVAFEVSVPAVTCYACEPPGTPNPLIVSFAASAAPLDRVGHTVDPKQAGITLIPEFAGQWTWDDDRTLRFAPAADWPVGTRYTVKFDRRHFVADPVRLDRYDFEFTSPAFAAKIAGVEFHQDPVVAGNKKVVATITFTHPVDPEKFEKRIRLQMFDRVTDKIEKEIDAPAYTVVYDKLKLNAYVHSAQLQVPPKSGRLRLTIASGIQSARGGNETKQALEADVEVPGLNSLKVTNVALDIARDERNEPKQILLVSASFSVTEKEMPQKVSAWLLPPKHPDPKLQEPWERRNGDRPFRWTSSNFRPEALNANTKLELTPIPGEQDHYENHSFRYTADPGRQVYVRVSSGLKSFGGYVLGEAVERILDVPEFPRELSILSKGSLLSLSGEKTLSLFARNVPAMRIEVGRLLPRQLQHLVSQTSGSFETPQFNNWAFDSANITERFVKVVPLARVEPGKPQYEALDLGDYLDSQTGGGGADRRGIFLLRVQAWDTRNDRPIEYTGENWNDARNGHLADARLIVVTDLGLVVKRAVDGSQDVFVQSIADGTPVAGASVDIIGRNGLPVLTETTDAEGHVRFPELKSFKREQQPVLYLARRGGDSSFMPLSQGWDERGRALDLSRFDVGGVQSNADRGALSAYLFSDRGIYRPGEEIRAAAIVRSQDWNRKFDGVPLRLEITDPRGTVIRRETFVPGPAGFGEIRQPTRETSPTGTYTISLSVVRNENYGDLIGSTTVQVRDFLPDRLRMSATFSAQSADGWVAPDDLTAQIQLENLFGTPAENRRVTTRMTLTPVFPAFRRFPDYQFYDPQFAKEGFSEELADTTTDAAGKATLALNLQRFARATYRVHLVMEGFEADGGRGVTTEAAQLVSNMKYLVGYKADGDLSYLRRDTPRTVNLIAIDPQSQQTAVDDLKLVRSEIRYVSVLMRQPNGTYKYESRRKESVIDEKPLVIAATGHALKLATDSPGNFAYIVRDPSGQQLARIDYQVAGEGNVTRALEKNAELELSLSKKDYAPGEDVEISIRAPYEGAGLITIERERTYAWRWFKTSTNSTVQKIKLPPGLEGNAYVAVTFVRDPGSAEIYTSPLSYGVQSFSIDVDARRNPVTVEAPSLVKPGEPLKLRYSTEKPSRIVLFAVDEGILQVAGYKTPDPLAHFFQKRALEVSTSQILDLILPEFRHLSLAAAPGGDAEGLLGKHLNPFRRKGEKPVAFWSGVLDADATTREVTYTVPDYFNGTLRVMAVAVADDRVGVHESKTIVRGDFVLSPNAPTTVTPGDEFEVSLGVSNNVEGSGADAQVSVNIETDRGLEVIGEPRQTLGIAEGREGSVRFRLRARDELGPSVLKFATSTTGGTGRRQIDLSIRPATPYMTRLVAGVIDRGERDVAISREMYPQHRKLDTGISVLPLQFAHGFVSYLSNYPYVCTEQIVSQAMPAVLLTSRPEFGYVRAENGADVSALIGELRSRQNDAGAYRLWPGSDQVVEFVAVYAQHLLIEAGERGGAIPGDLLENGNNYLRALATRDGNNLTDERQSAYAIYLLTRQGQRMATEIAAQRKRLNDRYRGQWEQDLAAAWLAASLDLMKQDRDANALIGDIRFATKTPDEVYYDAMTRDALLLFINARHFPERLSGIPHEVMTTLAQRVTGGYYHSLSAGTTLLALDAYANATQGAERNLAIAEVLKDKRVRALALPSGLFPKVDFTDQAAALRFGNNAGIAGYYLIETSGFDRKPPTAAIKEGLEVIREYTDDSGKPLAEIRMGQQVNVRLKFRGLKADYIGSIALVDLLPGGFELVVPTQPSEVTFAEAASDESDEGHAGGNGYAGWTCQICVSTSAMLEYADMREDRVVFYVSANRDVQEIVYRIKATNVGAYVVPPAYGEAMYDRSVVARSAAGRLTVARP